MIEHRWAFCDLCADEMVICGQCGNNCCNGCYGEIDGKPCDACPSAYDKQDREYSARMQTNQPEEM